MRRGAREPWIAAMTALSCFVARGVIVKVLVVPRVICGEVPIFIVHATVNLKSRSIHTYYVLTMGT